MPANLRWYPNELPALTQSTSSSSALETAVRSLQNDARTQSIRQALSRRSAGIIAAAEQNRGAIVIGSLMPLVIDPVVRSQPATQTASAVGTVGYVTGSSSESTARSVDRVTFSTDAVAALGNRASLARRKSAGASRLTSGFIAGGSESQTDAGLNAVEEFLYSTETAATLPSTLTFSAIENRQPFAFSSTQQAFIVSSLSHSISGCQLNRINFETRLLSLSPIRFLPQFYYGVASATPFAGVIFSIGNYYGVLGVSLFTFSTESIFYNPAPTDTTGDSRQVLGNGVNSWVFGGRRQNPTFNYRFTTATSSYTKIAADLSSPIVNAARVGSASVGYLCGGTTGPYHQWNSWVSQAGFQTITKFTFATEAITASPNALSTTRSHGVGISNFAGAFV